MNKQANFPKKYIILPIVLVAGIVVSSVFTTATSSVLESVKYNIATVSKDIEEVEEEIHEKTSLTLISEKIQVIGFTKGVSEYIKGVSAPLAYR